MKMFLFDCFLDMPADITFSYDHSTIYSQRQTYKEKGSLLQNLGPIKNNTLTKSRFSRHLISSAPDVNL